MLSDILITQAPSPNFGPRRDGATPDLIVLHYTAMESCDAALERLCATEFEVSAHYLISQTGDVFQMVAEEMRAWHAGAGAWGKCTDINSRSIGIELDNTGATPFSALQMNTLEALLSRIMERWKIAPHRVIGHSDMAAHRKFDPGRKFDWQRMAKQGFCVWPAHSHDGLEPEMTTWRTLAAIFGYSNNPAISDAATLQAFRDRFRAGLNAPLDREDMRIIQDLARRFPVDDPVTNP